jgi:hypothetical protein
LGPTGVGKSSLANVLIGQEVGCQDCMFPIGHYMNSMTKETKIVTAMWLGTGDYFTLIDTPGFGDSDGRDENIRLLAEMLDVLENDVKQAHTLLILLRGDMTRFSFAFQQTISMMKAMFGETFWDNVVIGVSFWKHDAYNVKQRNHMNKTESWLESELQEQFKEKFKVEKDLPFVFIDSFSQQPYNMGDQDQQVAFQRESEKLWNHTLTQKTLRFKTIDEVLQENAKFYIENKSLKIQLNITQKNLAQVNGALTEVEKHLNISTMREVHLNNTLAIKDDFMQSLVDEKQFLTKQIEDNQDIVNNQLISINKISTDSAQQSSRLSDVMSLMASLTTRATVASKFAISL